jgi:hypothetical protein
MRKLIVSAVIGTLALLPGVVATPATAATPWASLDSVSRVTADNPAPGNPDLWVVSVRATYQCRPVSQWYQCLIWVKVYRPSTQATYTTERGYGALAVCDRHTHTSPGIRAYCCHDARFKAGESVRVTVFFQAYGYPMVTYRRWTTIRLGDVPWKP